MKIEILASKLDPWARIVEYQESRPNLAGKFGATACFVGTMRDFNEGDEVFGMTLEHYPEMTEMELRKIVAKAIENVPVLDVLVAHRVGELLPNDPIVVVAVWSAHRGAAFDVCRILIEELKHNAPFWKKEVLGQTSRWVEKNTAA